MQPEIWAIADLHLPAHQKPMDIFGTHWEGHFEKICADWIEKVGPEDIVLLPGDISWAMHTEEALDDLNAIGILPGKKILLRGNHDYWWSSIGRLRRLLPSGMLAIQNDSVFINGTLIAGSRGWNIPSAEDHDSDDARIYLRERQRLEMSLAHARKTNGDAPLIVMMHFPPCSDTQSGFSDLLEKYNAKAVVYGHLHGPGIQTAVHETKGGVPCYLVSCDSLSFQLKQIS